MTGSDDLLTVAVPYALHALSDADRDALEAALASSDQADAFFDEVRAVRETVARLSSSTAVEPPAALRRRVLAAVADDPVPLRRHENRWRSFAMAAAAVVAVGLAAVGVEVTLRETPTPSTAEQIFAAPDVRTVSGEIPTGGKATFVYSHERNAGVLVMNGVSPPQSGTVYQMWLVRNDGATSAGTMDATSVSPSTTAVVPDLGDSVALAFTVEPGSGSSSPTGEVFAELPLT
jgi:anti-sigma-K factor RskA